MPAVLLGNTRLFPQLPTDVTKIITGYLPYSRYTMERVSKAWRENVKTYLPRPTIEQVVQACNSKQDALCILSDENLYDQFCVRDLLALSAWVPEIVADDTLTKCLSQNDFLILYSQSPLEFINYFRLYNDLTDTFLGDLVSKNPQLAKAVFEDKELLEQLNAHQLTIFGKSSKEFAFKIIKDPVLKEKIGMSSLIEFAIKFKEIALYLLSKAEFYTKIAGFYLSQIGIAHKAAANRILQLCKDKSISHLSRDDFTKIASHDKEMAAKILACDSKVESSRYAFMLVTDEKTAMAAVAYCVRNKLPYTQTQFVFVARFSEILARVALEKYKESLMGADLIYLLQANEKLGLEMVANVQYREKILGVLSPILIANIQISPKVVMEIAKYADLGKIICFAEHYPSIASKLYKQAKDRFAIKGRELSDFGACNPKVAMKILKNNQAAKKMTFFFDMVRHSPRAMHAVLCTPNLVSRLTNHKRKEYVNISTWNNVRNAKMIVNNPALKESQLFVSHSEKLSEEVQTATRIHTLAKQLVRSAHRL